MSLNEADTCRIYVTPNLQRSGWEKLPHSINEQKTFTDGRVKIEGQSFKRNAGKRADYLLRYTRDFSRGGFAVSELSVTDLSRSVFSGFGEPLSLCWLSIASSGDS